MVVALLIYSAPTQLYMLNVALKAATASFGVTLYATTIVAFVTGYVTWLNLLSHR